MHVNPEYEPRVVAFIDILGFRNLVSRLDSDDSLHTKLHSALSHIKKFGRLAGNENTAQKDLEASVFSDCIVISSEVGNHASVTWTCVGLQAELLGLGILTRGGISIGKMVHKDDLLYGEGMIRAYDIESKAAIYPRVVIDPELIDDFNSGHRAMFLSHDSDGLWHTDPFAFGIMPPGSQALLEDAWDPHLVFLENFEKAIQSEINSSSDTGHIAKWGWLEGQRKQAHTFHTQFGKARLWHIMEQSGAFKEQEQNAAGQPATRLDSK